MSGLLGTRLNLGSGACTGLCTALNLQTGALLALNLGTEDLELYSEMGAWSGWNFHTCIGTEDN